MLLNLFSPKTSLQRSAFDGSDFLFTLYHCKYSNFGKRVRLTEMILQSNTKEENSNWLIVKLQANLEVASLTWTILSVVKQGHRTVLY